MFGCNSLCFVEKITSNLQTKRLQNEFWCQLSFNTARNILKPCLYFTVTNGIGNQNCIVILSLVPKSLVPSFFLCVILNEYFYEHESLQKWHS